MPDQSDDPVLYSPDLPSSPEEIALRKDLSAYDNGDIYFDPSQPQQFILGYASFLLTNNPRLFDTKLDGDLLPEHFVDLAWNYISRDPNFPERLREHGCKDWLNIVEPSRQLEAEMAARFKTDQWKFFLRHFPKLLEAVFNMAVFSSFMAMGLALWREQPDARLNEFEKTVRTTIVSIGLGLIVLLLLVVFRAVPSSTWDRVSEATPKRALWALLGLAGIAICLLSGALIDNWRKKKAAPATIAEAQQPQHLRMFGLLWDDNQNPLCPADQIPLSFFMRHASQHFDILQCARCGNRFQIRHDLMGNLQLANAKQMIRDGFGLV